MSIDPAVYDSATEFGSYRPVFSATPAAAAPDDSGESGLERLERVVFGADGLTFEDLLDVVNPLQHIPVVSTIYRSLTGDTIAPGPRLAGGGLFGGFIGLAAAAVNVAVEGSTGKDIGDHVYAMVTGGDGFMGDGQAPGGTAIAGLEPGERTAALLAGATGSPAATPPGPADPADPAYATAPALPGAAPARPSATPASPATPATPATALDLANLEPGQRVAAMLAAVPASSAASAIPAAPATPAAPAAPATLIAASPSVPAPGAASGSEGAEPTLPSFSSADWQTLTQALRAYGAGQETQAQPSGGRGHSQR